MQAYAIRQMADERIALSYKSGRISWDEYKDQKEQHRQALFAEEMASCRSYKEAIASWVRE